MSDHRGVLIVGEDTIIQGEVRDARRVEVRGYVEGDVTAGDVVVHEGGRMFGKLRAESAEVRGQLQGEVRVHNLFAIKSTGSVTGNVRYGRLAMDEGAELDATVRNVPPSIAGDLDLVVGKGRSVRITLADLTALDPDDKSDDLLFEVSNTQNGMVTLSGAPGLPAYTFTQTDLSGGTVYFAHDGTETTSAQFDVVVTDKSGAGSGPAKTVTVAITP